MKIAECVSGAGRRRLALEAGQTSLSAIRSYAAEDGTVEHNSDLNGDPMAAAIGRTR